jgi:hypothetical protein
MGRSGVYPQSGGAYLEVLLSRNLPLPRNGTGKTKDHPGNKTADYQNAETGLRRRFAA